MALRQQAALEQAVVNLLLTQQPGGLVLTAANCRRMATAQPPPSCGPVFLAVWGDGGRRAGQTNTTALDAVHSLSVTASVRFVQPYDRLVEHRDYVEQLMEDVVNIVGRDIYSYTIINAANELAGFRSSGAPDGTHAVGFCEALRWDGTDPIQECGPDWFHASLDNPTYRDCGFALRARFTGARRVQNYGNVW